MQTVGRRRFEPKVLIELGSFHGRRVDQHDAYADGVRSGQGPFDRITQQLTTEANVLILQVNSQATQQDSRYRPRHRPFDTSWHVGMLDASG